MGQWNELDEDFYSYGESKQDQEIYIGIPVTVICTWTLSARMVVLRREAKFAMTTCTCIGHQTCLMTYDQTYFSLINKIKGGQGREKSLEFTSPVGF